MQRKFPLQINFFTILYILLLSAASGFIFNYFNPDGITFVNLSKSIGGIKQKVQFVKPITVSTEDAYLLFTKNVRPVDVRPAAEYQQGHIPNAVNLPLEYLRDAKRILSLFNAETPLFLYGNGQDQRTLEVSGEEIFAAGYKKLYLFPGGIQGWITKNYPVEK